MIRRPSSLMDAMHIHDVCVCASVRPPRAPTTHDRDSDGTLIAVGEAKGGA